MILALRGRTPHGQSFSAGVVERGPHESATPADLVAAADKALYRAKQGGRNRVVAAAQPAQGRPGTGGAGPVRTNP